MSEQYTALIIDLKKSRSYSSEVRNFVQYYIMGTIRLLNGRLNWDFVREVDFSAGDEVQGLFGSPASAYCYYRLFAMLLHPVELRAGIGLGSWDVRLDDKGTTGQDGPAYHHARYAIQNADAGEGYPVLLYSGNRGDAVVNTIIGGAAAIGAQQSVYQNQLMLLTELLFPVWREEADSGRVLEELLAWKNQFDHGFGKLQKPLPFDRAEGPWRIQGGTAPDGEAFFITQGKQRGIPTRLAELLHISRQTIDKALKAGNVYTARNMAITALELLKEL